MCAKIDSHPHGTCLQATIDDDINSASMTRDIVGAYMICSQIEAAQSVAPGLTNDEHPAWQASLRETHPALVSYIKITFDMR